MTTVVVPWGGNRPAMLASSLGTALESFQPSEVLVIGGYEEDARKAFVKACEWLRAGPRWDTLKQSLLWESNPLFYVQAHLRQTDEAMRLACSLTFVTDPYVWSADDVFWPHSGVSLKMLENMRPWTLGLAEQSPQLGQGIHGTALQHSLSSLLEKGWEREEIHNFEGHWPLVVHKENMLAAMENAPKGQKRTSYGNLQLRLSGNSAQVREDIKVFAAAKLPTRDHFVSTSSGVSVKEIERWLQRDAQ